MYIAPGTYIMPLQTKVTYIVTNANKHLTLDMDTHPDIMTKVAPDIMAK